MKAAKVTLLVVFILTACSNCVMSQIPGYVPVAGLVSWYPFNGDAEDESLNDNDGTVSGASLAEDRFGIANSAYSCDGVNDLISLSGNGSITNDFSISFWFNPQSSDPGYLIDRDFCGTDNDWSIYYSENRLNVRYGMGGVDYFIIPDDINEVNNWFHIVIVRNESLEKLVYYLNGSVLDQIDYPAGTYTNTGLPILIGESNCLPDVNANFNGLVDDIGIWDRPLSNAEVVQLYQSCDLDVMASPVDLGPISAGTDAQFTCVANDPGATFQWESDLGFGFVPLSDAGQYSGTINDTLMVSSVSLANDNQKFRCVISSATCDDTSEIAVLYVVAPTDILALEGVMSVDVYPNPVMDDFIIINTSSKDLLDVRVFNSYGSVVSVFHSVSNGSKLLLSDITPGYYVVQFCNQSRCFNRSVIISK